ncbi:unnamed protein product [Haemonchus placei]|uniref:ZP domain-containing protein n=1 Tax=Haemonchus placei TaxID=6290 RepID=A0A0N4VVR2_HAEPC|nr:unnamed protein product [Haemonchus placei]
MEHEMVPLSSSMTQYPDDHDYLSSRRTPHPMTISYEVTVVIQHHPLFITAGDRAYRLNCIYRQLESTLTQKINIK